MRNEREEQLWNALEKCDYLSIPQVAELLGTTPATARRVVNRLAEHQAVRRECLDSAAAARAVVRSGKTAAGAPGDGTGAAGCGALHPRRLDHHLPRRADFGGERHHQFIAAGRGAL